MNDITAKLQKYLSEFAAWAESAQQSAALDASMMKTFRELEPGMQEVRTTVEDLYKQADAAEAATRAAVRMWMMIAFLVTVAVLAVVSFLLGRSISKALSGMVDADVGDFLDHRCRRRRAGRRHAGDLPQHPACRAGAPRMCRPISARSSAVRARPGLRQVHSAAQSLSQESNRLKKRGRALPGFGSGGLRLPVVLFEPRAVRGAAPRDILTTATNSCSQFKYRESANQQFL